MSAIIGEMVQNAAFAAEHGERFCIIRFKGHTFTYDYRVHIDKLARKVTFQDMFAFLRDRHQINPKEYIIRRVKDVVTKSKDVNIVKTKSKKATLVSVGEIVVFEMIHKFVEISVDVSKLQSSVIARNKQHHYTSKVVYMFNRYCRMKTLFKFVQVQHPTNVQYDFYVGNKLIEQQDFNRSIHYFMDL